jgi:type IV fimbrial biogenesis protein FimT
MQSIRQDIKKLNAGTTLLELLIVLAIISISFTVVGPNINRFVAHNRISAQINQTSAMLYRARLHAITHQESVTLCPATDFKNCSTNWQAPIIGFVDNNRNKIRDDDEKLLISSQAITKTEVLRGPNNLIRFHDTGVSSSAATLLLCPSDKDASLAKALFLSLQGRVRISKDSDRDGIDDRMPGTNLSCDN